MFFNGNVWFYKPVEFFARVSIIKVEGFTFHYENGITYCLGFPNIRLVMKL